MCLLLLIIIPKKIKKVVKELLNFKDLAGFWREAVFFFPFLLAGIPK
jgi:hypothetical protein